MFKSIFIIAIIALIVINACTHEPDSVVINKNTGVTCSADTVYFQNQILPILVSTCAMASCHNNQYHSVDIDVTSYENVLKLVVPKNAASSILYLTITTSEPTDKMPIYPSPVWNPEQINLLKTWIDQGALNNRCTEQCSTLDTLGITYTNFVQPLITDHCQGCHIQNSWGGGIILNSYDDVKSIAQDGRLYGSVAWQINHIPMPKFQNQLPNCLISKLKTWIDNGMCNSPLENQT